MCPFGGKGGLFSGGNIGSALGSLAGLGLDFAFPELGIPLALATGGGGFLGGLLGGAKPEQAAIGGLTSGALAGVGELASGGGFFDAAGGGGITSLFGGGTDAAAAIPGGTDIGTAVAPAVEAGTALSPLTGTASAGIGGDFIGPPLSAAPAATAGLGDAVVPAAGVPAAPTGGGGSPFYDEATQTFSGGGGGTGGGSFLSGVGGKALDYVKEHPFQVAGAGALALPLLMGQGTPPGLNTLKGEAALEAQRGNEMANALRTGQLPPGAQSAIDNAMQAAKATTRSNFANLGISGSTQESQAESGIDQAAAAQKFKMLSDVRESGLREVGAADSLYKTIMDTELASDKETSAAIARIAAALAGGGFAKAA